MAGIDVGGGHGRRSVNQELPLVPFIDFLLCLVMFLLVTAVWSQMSRLNADAQVPGPPNPEKDVEKKIDEEWKQNGSHRAATDKKFDQAILHTDNTTQFVEIVAVIDAIYTP